MQDLFIIENEIVFTNTEMKNEWNVFFNTHILASFPLVEVSKNVFWYGAKFRCGISFNVLHILNSYSEMNFLKNSPRSESLVSIEDCSLE